MAAKDPLEPFAIGSFPVVQFDPGQKPFVSFGMVPVAVSHEKTELTFIFELGMRQRSIECPVSTFGLAVSRAA